MLFDELALDANASIPPRRHRFIRAWENPENVKTHELGKSIGALYIHNFKAGIW